MTISRKVFKVELKKCKKNKINEISSSIQEKFDNRSIKEFWLEVNSHNLNTSKATVVDGYSNENDIMELFLNKFVPSEGSGKSEKELTDKLNERLNKNNVNMNLKVSVETLKVYILKLKLCKGHDEIHSCFLREASDNFLDNLSVFINMYFNHSYLPYKLLRGTISPIVKDSKKSSSMSSNYRPIMISSSILKLIELHILTILKEKIPLNSLQFGFMDGVSTTDACLTLKEIINSYRGKKSCVFANFINLSKAFDLIDPFILCNKLLETT